MLVKQLKFKYEKALKKVAEKTREETTQELEKKFEETVKSRARKTLTQMRDSQQKTIKALQKKVVTMQSEMQQLQGERNLMQTKHELHIEQYKSQVSDVKQFRVDEKRQSDARIKQFQEQVHKLSVRNQTVSADSKEQSGKQQALAEHLRDELQAKDDELATLKSQVREQLREITINMNCVEKEHEEKMAMKQQEHEALMHDCQERMKVVLDKKKAQNHRGRAAAQTAPPAPPLAR